jgi:glutamyl-tRNA synthetase
MTVAPRVRFAPSPTGYLHVGGARTALFNWLVARREGGVFVLRIEDTDRERSSDEMTRAILDGMTWLGLDWDEGPAYQANGIDRHRADALRLLDSGQAYRCFCTPASLQARRDAMGDEYRYDRACAALAPEEIARRLDAGDPFTVRFHVPEGTTEWDDSVHGPTRFRNEDIEDFIILRTDGTPVYNLAVVSDDVEMAINLVIRGDDHLSNTPKQILLYRALGAEVPRFAHLPMILGPDGKRLSKRHGATSVGEYRDQGILPLALVNFLALLGWNPGDEQEIFTREELIQSFSLERVNKKSSVFDPEKLVWMNGQHLARMEGAALLDLVADRLVEAGLTTHEEISARRTWYEGLMDLLKPRAHTLDGFAPQARGYLLPSVEYDPAAVAKHFKDPVAASESLRTVREVLGALPEWTPEAVESALRDAAAAAGAGLGKLAHPLRLALTGVSVSPGIHEVVAHMGPDLVNRRIDDAIAYLQGNRTLQP